MIKFDIEVNPKPQTRPRFIRQGRAYEEPKTKAYRNTLTNACMKAMEGKRRLEGTLMLEVNFYVEPPKRIANVKRNQQALQDETMHVDVRPDLDNYIKAILDSMNGHCFKDDGQIAVLISSKKYSLKPRIEIKLEEIA